MKYLKRWYNRNKLRRDLNNLTDKEMNDIGLSRGMIEWVVRETYK